MKKLILIPALLASISLSSTQLHAKSDQATSKQQQMSLASGATARAALGDGMQKQTQIKQQNLALAEAKQLQNQLEQEITMIQQNLDLNDAKTADKYTETLLNNDKIWMTESLKLSVMFITNSSGLSDKDYEDIQAYAEIMHQFTDLNLQLDGYADPRGSEQDNLELSKQRVIAVKEAYKNYGINEDRIFTQAFGEMPGISLQDDNDAFAMARKVDINFTLESTRDITHK